VPLEELYAQAVASKKRLVLAGHSLGGAVALLCAIKLLRIWAARKLGGAYVPPPPGPAGAGRAQDGAGKGRAAGGGGGGGKGGGGGRGGGRQGRQRRDNEHLAAAAAAAAADPNADPNVRCITFAAPAVANESLAAEVVAAGWDRLMSNFVQPGALVVRAPG
jgi:pimeloyl-ACP methyl ester carboxylesterase